MCILEPHCMRNEDGKIHAKFLQKIKQIVPERIYNPITGMGFLVMFTF